MPQNQPPPPADALRYLRERLDRVDRELARLRSGAGRLAINRGDHEAIAAPYEGEVMVNYLTDEAWYYSRQEWRPFGGGGAIYAIENNEVDFPVVTGDNQFQWEIPEDLDGAVLLKVEAYVTTPSSSGTIEVQLARMDNDGTGVAGDMLTTKINIEADDYNSRTAALQPVVVDAPDDEVAWGDHFRIDVDAAGSGATGLGLIAYFTPAAAKRIAIEGAQGDPGGVTDWTGAYDGGDTYIVNQAVSYGGASYVARQNVPVSIIPGVTAGWEDYWMVLNEGSEFAALTIYDNNQGRALDIGTKGYVQVPFDCEIVSYVFLADQLGDLIVDIRKDSYANYPPTSGDSICAGIPPTLSAAFKATDTTLVGWTTSISEGDILYFVVPTAPDLCTSFSLTLKIRRL